MPDLSVVIVSWNVQDLLRECLRSILEADDIVLDHSMSSTINQPSIEIIVVDAGSNDDTPLMLRTEFPSVQLIEMGDNVGFSKGNNIGITASQGNYVMLLNPDTQIVSNALSTLIGYLQGNPQVGVVGPKLLNTDGSTQSSRRRFPTLWTGIFESTWLEHFAPPGLLDWYYMADQDEKFVTPVDWLTGAALVVRREAIDQVGSFDEAYFMYSEELDWQKRIKGAGWEIIYLPIARVIHYGGMSSDQVVPLRHIRFQSSKIRYFHKHHGPLAAALIRTVILGNYVGQLALEAVKGLFGHKRDLRQERVRAYWQVLRSGLRSS